MKSQKQFSIVIPTYSGLNTIKKTFKSLLTQDSSGIKYEVIVVIDGPNELLRELVDQAQQDFQKKGINFEVEQFKENKGRFEARIAGAKLAKYNQLLFVDDRIYLAENYFKILKGISEELMLANVIEKEPDNYNLISATLTYVRRGLYGDKWGVDFPDYYINNENFENSPKGTASLWVKKEMFLAACEKVAHNQQALNKYVNEDTKILRAMVDAGARIFRTSKLNIYYQPRNNFKDTVKHLYGRGPRFVDYYVKPKSKFFPLLIAIYVMVAVAVILAFIKLIYLAYLAITVLAGTTLLALLFGKDLKGIFTLFVGLPLVLVIFAAGIIKGTFLRILR